jgi:glycosyltransferase involved in cell wall biosynthesis
VTLRVLYASAYPLPYSESYTRGEIQWMQAQGADVRFWAKSKANAPAYPPEPYVTVTRSIGTVINEFKPHVIHTHRVDTALAAWPHADMRGIPLTVRGHSVDFDEASYRKLTGAARLWLFPHMAALFPDQPNVEALPVAYDPRLYYPEEPDPMRYVVRTGFANANKDIASFNAVARLCPKVPFELVLTGPYQGFMTAIAFEAPNNVRVHRGLTNEEAATIVRKAWVCLRSHDTNAHPYGMPISIAEAMGAGVPVVARAGDPSSPSRFGPEDYVKDAGYCYTTVETGARIVREISGWPRNRWEEARATSYAQAQQYRTDVVLPRMLDTWLGLAT